MEIAKNTYLKHTNFSIIRYDSIIKIIIIIHKWMVWNIESKTFAAERPKDGPLYNLVYFLYITTIVNH